MRMLTFLISLFLFSSIVFAAEEKYDPLTGFTIFFAYNERPIGSGTATLISSPIGNLYSTGKSLSCAPYSVYKGEQFNVCNFNIRWFSNNAIIGDNQHSGQCFGTWSGALSTTCAIGPYYSGQTYVNLPTRWEAYVVGLFDADSFRVAGIVTDEITNNKIPNAKIEVQDNLRTKILKSTFTDMNGVYIFDLPNSFLAENPIVNICAGLESIDYFEKCINRDLRGAFETTINIAIKPSSSDPSFCKGTGLYGSDGKTGKMGTACCINGKVQIPPLYGNQIGSNGDICSSWGVNLGKEICGNGKDDDYDQMVDESDITGDRCFPEICGDSVDNDFDGLVDEKDCKQLDGKNQFMKILPFLLIGSGGAISFGLLGTKKIRPLGIVLLVSGVGFLIFGNVVLGGLGDKEPAYKITCSVTAERDLSPLGFALIQNADCTRGTVRSCGFELPQFLSFIGAREGSIVMRTLDKTDSTSFSVSILSTKTTKQLSLCGTNDTSVTIELLDKDGKVRDSEVKSL